MPDPCPIDKLADQIRAAFEPVMVLPPKTVDYLSSTVDCHGAEDLRRMLRDQDLSEAAGIYDLAAMPDETFQIGLEPVLLNTACRRIDIDAVIGNLVTRGLHAIVQFPDHPDSVDILLPPPIIAQLVHRLRISRQWDSRLTETIINGPPPDIQMALFVCLRNSRCNLAGPGICQTLIDLIAGFHGPWPEITAMFRFLLTFLEHAPPAGIDLQHALFARKQRLAAQLARQDDYQRRLSHSNLETQLMLGNRMPHIDGRATSHQMQLIDDICLALYGQPGPMTPSTPQARIFSPADLG